MECGREQLGGDKLEAEFHNKRYVRLRTLKEKWPNLLKALRQEMPQATSIELGNLALERRDNWVARCAFCRADIKQNSLNLAAMLGRARVAQRTGHHQAAMQILRQIRESKQKR